MINPFKKLNANKFLICLIYFLNMYTKFFRLNFIYIKN